MLIIHRHLILIFDVIYFNNMSQDHFRKLERMYLGANINTQHYPTTSITIEEGQATIALTLDESYFHALGAMHGSVYFKLLDDAAFFAVNSVVEDAFVLTTSFDIKLLRPASEGVIKAIGSVTSIGDHQFEAKAELFNAKGKKIAFGTGVFVKSKVELNEEIGYK